LYLPATQAEQTPPSVPVNPTLQVQEVTTELDTTEFEFTGHAKHTDAALAPTVSDQVPTPQSVHTALPLVVLYLPATQVEHVLPSGPVLPAAHGGTTHPFTDDVPLTEVLPAAQAMHAAEVYLFVAVEYFPTPQSVQAAVPATSLYLPATHPAHTAVGPSGPVNPAAQIH
jgi:hypothetical protein